jgi:hypothetical protein
MTFNPNLHPRAGGGRFGQANNPKAIAATATAKNQLLTRAKQDRTRIAALQAEAKTLRANLQALLHPATPKSHTTKTTKKVAGKSGASGKVKKKQTTKTVKRTTGTATRTPNTVAGIRSRLVLITGTIHALQQDAAKCDQLASQM